MRSMLPGGFAPAERWLYRHGSRRFVVGDRVLCGRSEPGRRQHGFRRYRGQTGSGLHWNWLAPIGDVATPDVSTRTKTEIGFQQQQRRSAGRKPDADHGT